MLPSVLDAVLFDAGGTLVNLDYAFIAQTARWRGAPVSVEALPRAEAAARRAVDEQARDSRGFDSSDSARRRGYFEHLLRAAGIAEAAAGGIAVELDLAHRERGLWRVPLDGAFETLSGLRARGLRTAVVSNADGRLHDVLTSVGLARHLDLIVDSHLEGVEKPDPEIFRRALERLGVQAERVVYIGDIYSIDAVGARAAGLAPIIIDPTGSYRAIDCPTITCLRELLDRIGPRE